MPIKSTTTTDRRKKGEKKEKNPKNLQSKSKQSDKNKVLAWKTKETKNYYLPIKNKSN